MKNIRNVMAALLCACLVQAAYAKLTPTPDVNQFFITPDQPAALTWTASNQKSDSINYKIKDYWGHVVASGQATISQKGLVAMQVELHRGFYLITFPSIQQTFGIAAMPAYSDKLAPFFAIDAAMSHLIEGPKGLPWIEKRYKRFQAVRTGLMHVLKRSGINTARERMRWSDINPAPGKWNWQTDQQYTSIRRKYRRMGVPVLEMFQEVPGYMTYTGNPIAIPRNMLAAAKSWIHLAHRWRPSWAGVEIWNEPTNYVAGPVPADQLATLVKVFSYVLHQKYPKLLVGGPAMATGTGPLTMAISRIMARSGALQAMDYWSFHDYRNVMGVQSHIAYWRKALARFGRPHLPLWITESGKPWKGGPRPPMTASQTCALVDTMKAVEAKACGVARYFAFVLPGTNLHRDGKTFGMMGRQATPLRSFVAYAQAIQALAHHSYIGDLRVADPAVKRARVFAEGPNAVIAVYTRQVKQEASVTLGLKPDVIQKVRGIDGRVLKIKKAGQIPVPDGLSYVYTSGPALSGKLNVNTPAMKLYRLAQTSAKPVETSPVVLQFLPNQKRLTLHQYDYWINAKKKQTAFPITIRAINLGQKQHTVRISLEATDGDHHTKQLGSPYPIEIKPQSQQSITFQVNLSDLGTSQTVQILASAKIAKNNDDTGAIQPTLITLHKQATLSELLKQYPRHDRLDISDLNLWRPRHARGTQTAFTWTADKTWQLTMGTGKKGWWSFPDFLVKTTPPINPAKVRGIIIRGRCQFGKAGILITRKPVVNGIDQYKAQTFFASDGQWHALFIPIDSFVAYRGANPVSLDGASSWTIRLGMGGGNNRSKSPELEISDLYIAY